MKNRVMTLMLSLLLLFAANPLCADNTSMRCGNELISIGDTMHKVRNTCGNPVSEQRIGEKRTFKIFKDDQLKIENLTYVFEWFYEKGSGVYILTFEGSRLVKKEYKK